MNEAIINFPYSILHRESLSNNFPNGVGDIVGLLTQGWNYNSPRPFGKWHNKKILGLSSRNGNNYINTIINKYRRLYPQIVITIPANWM